MLTQYTENKNSQKMRWTANRVCNWYQARPWLCGFNFVPSTAINSTEMWQSETFDPGTIDRELNWAQKIGFNSCRVFLQYLVRQNDPDGFVPSGWLALTLVFSKHTYHSLNERKLVATVGAW